jgi:hypothetical protein
VNLASQQKLSRHCHLMAYVCTLLQDFWEGRRIYEEWQTTLLRVLYKKGDQKEPTNY